MKTPAVIDHVVIRAATLETGAAYIEDALGVALAPGGAHAAMGTHNMLAGIGDAYLEVISIDPDADAPMRPRWFGLDDDPSHTGLAAWVVRVPSIPDDPETGAALALARGDLSWQIAVRDDGRIPFEGAGPLAIRWESVAAAPPPSNARLISLIALHPEPARLSSCTPMTAAENASSHTVSLSPKRRCQNSITAARKQKRERWAKKPKARPMAAPPAASRLRSP